ncbi:hypothetical protein ACHAXS_014120 [Conticribra weissflogii]
MVRGNWQRRVERTEARRTAAKLHKEQRRNKRINGGVIGETEEYHRASYLQLVDWLDDKGGILLSSYETRCPANQENISNRYVIVDIWTEDRPKSRPEYQVEYSTVQNEEAEDHFSDDGPSKGRVSKSKQNEKSNPRWKYRKVKGKSHPNARNKSGKHADENEADKEKSVPCSNTSSKLCAQDFYFGRDKCATSVAPKINSKKSGRSRSNSFGATSEGGCSLHHYHQFPKAKKNNSITNETPSIPPLTLAQVLNSKYQPHPNQQTQDGPFKPTMSLPTKIREFTLQSAFDAATATPLQKPLTSFLGSENNQSDFLGLTDNEGEIEKKTQPSIDMTYHSRVFVAVHEGRETETNDESGDANNESTCRSSKFGKDKSEDVQRNSSDDEHVSDDENAFGNGDDETNNHSNQTCDSGDKTPSNGVINALEKILVDENISQTSLVYLAIQGVLIYDRHRGGLLTSSYLEGFLLHGEDIDENAFICAKEPAQSQEALQIHEQLTHHVLDEILSYLDDEAAGTLPQVCPNWNDEIGKRSPQLWKMLLGRHGWPNISSEGSSEAARNVVGSGRRNVCNSHRHAFVAHYSAIRDIRAMILATNYLKNGSTAGSSYAGSRARSGSISNKKHGIEYAMQVFKATRGAPVLDMNARNSCVVKIWDERNSFGKVGARALVSYTDDCTLRLFEAVKSSQGINTNNSTNSPILCRQVVCLRAAPPSISKKKDNCDLSSMDLDDDLVACLVHETQMENDARSTVIPWMTVISREDLSCAGNEGILDEESVQSFDLRAAIFDHILVGKCSPDDDCSAEYDALHEPLHNYLSIFDGDTSEITISVTPKIIACAKGHFLFHAFISIPQYSEADDGDDHMNRVHPPSNGNRLFLFSTCKHGAIVKSLPLDVYPSSVGLFSSRPVRRRASETTTTAMCTNVVAIIRNTPFMVSVQVQNSGKIEIENKLMMEGDQARSLSDTHAVVTSSHVILASNPGPENDCVLHFLNKFERDAPMCEMLHSVSFGGPGSKLKNLFSLQNDYVVAVVATNTTLQVNGGDEEEHIDFDGHWFGNEESNTAFVFHIPTRRELYRSELPCDPISVDSLGNTLAINVSSYGFVLTGLDARDVGRISLNERRLDDTIMSPSTKTPKPKKKRLASKTGKKDGFARGMSLRG